MQWKDVIKEAVQTVVIMTILDRTGLIAQAKARGTKPLARLGHEQGAGRRRNSTLAATANPPSRRL